MSAREPRSFGGGFGSPIASNLVVVSVRELRCGMQTSIPALPDLKVFRSTAQRGQAR